MLVRFSITGGTQNPKAGGWLVKLASQSTIPSPATETDNSSGLSFFVARNRLVSLSISSNTALMFLVRNDFPSNATFSDDSLFYYFFKYSL